MDGFDSRDLTEEFVEGFGDFGSDEIVGETFVGHEETVFGGVAIHPVANKLLILRNLRIQISIPPLDPLLQRRPLTMHRQVIPHLVNVIEETGYALHRIPYHDKPPLDLLVEFHQYAIALGIVSLDGNDLLSPSVVVPIVPGLETGERLDEVPRHAGAAARVGGGVGYGHGRVGFLGPGQLTSAVGEGFGETAIGAEIIDVVGRGGNVGGGGGWQGGGWQGCR
mmetsp:Transcript_10303/g.18768  ORF Transcript_10303/g.18768 Transcript_10303/m.18768 type:complete len:223 (-) Transcript_10303:209-877(-)